MLKSKILYYITIQKLLYFIKAIIMILEFAKKIFSNKNDRLVGHYRKEARKINALEAT